MTMMRMRAIKPPLMTIEAPSNMQQWYPTCSHLKPMFATAQHPSPVRLNFFRAGYEMGMIVIGLVLLLLGLVLAIPILTTAGVIVLIIGLVLMLLGRSGRPVRGRAHYW
jgi:hypothetical protein